MPGERRKRHRFQASFRWMDHCIFWRLGFRQYSFYHVARVPQRIAPYAWTRSLVGCHAAFPLTFRRQVRHQTQEHPPNSSLLSRGYGEAPRGAPCSRPLSLPGPGQSSDPRTSLRVPPGYAGDATGRLVAQCGRSSLTPPARRQDRAAARKDPEEQSAQPGGTRSHRARSVCPLDSGGPYGCRCECVQY
jgi:hypothetical protein